MLKELRRHMSTICSSRGSSNEKMVVAATLLEI